MRPPFCFAKGQRRLLEAVAHGTIWTMLNLLFSLAAPTISISPPSPPAPLITTVTHNEPIVRRQTVVALTAMSGRCADGPLDISEVEAPMADLARPSSSNANETVNVRFYIDENGRPLGITRDPAGYGLMADLTPSLAASRFVPGAPRNACSIVYEPKRTDIAEADINALIGYSIFAQQRPPKEVFDRIAPVGSDCNMPQPAVLLRAFPDFTKISATAGQMDWSMVTFDINASGKPVRLTTYGTTGNVALDKAAIKAVGQSRFAKGARQKCLYPYWRRGGTLAAPEGKEIAAYRSGDSNCPQTVQWKYQPALVYPEPFRRRDIEGWAVIAFDLAPWGAVGNVKVVAAEPASEFGEAARLIILGSSTAPSAQGYSNCVVKVRYAMRNHNRQPFTNPD